MSSRIILGIGSGRCGTASLAKVLDQQLGFSMTHEEWPSSAPVIARQPFVSDRRPAPTKAIPPGTIAPDNQN